ncbi:hypothetical protein [Pseudooceanicola atlanticus]|uniref:hypothetical protein n=1 Tax=Pseudooceanicola atlanticus TaxID=1461694 RepID=UPI0023546A27|nr:hypothetical protein [Pseudooceanicola atlanticus]
MRESEAHTGSVDDFPKIAENFTRQELTRLVSETGENPTEGAINALAQNIGQNVEKMLASDAEGN